MEKYFGRCFVIIGVVKPGQVVKRLRLIDLRIVDGIGLKIVPWRKADSLDFF